MNTFLQYIKLFFISGLMALTSNSLRAQPIPSCGTNEPMGTNLICNGDFERGDSCFTTQYLKRSAQPDVGCGTCNRTWSNPFEYEVVTNVVTQFHDGFTNTPNDNTPGPGNHFMAVDGACNVGQKVWSQTVTVFPSTNYYFTMWFTSLFPSNPALLQFDINGINVGLQQQLPAVANGVWQQYTFTWASGATSGPVTISIENMTVTGCSNGNDFAIDDISFTSGCQFGAAGPQPDLGPDKSLCLNGGTVTLNSGITPTATMNATWSTGATGTGLAAPYTINVNTPGTYSVCVRDGGSCIKSDVIVVTNTFSVNIGPDVTLCNPTTATLDAVLSVPGITYVWRRNGTPITGATSRTYTATMPGTYQVDVTVPGCGTRSDAMDIFSNAAIPNNGTFCPPGAANLSVTGTGTYEWYTASAGGTLVNTGANYNPTPAATTTYWVKDISTFSYTVGPKQTTPGVNASPFTAGFGGAIAATEYIRFNATIPFTLDAVTIYTKIYNPNTAITAVVNLRDNTGTLIATVSRNLIGPPTVPVNNDWGFVVPVGFNVPAGAGLRLDAVGTNTGGSGLYWAQGGANNVTWASYNVPGVVSLVGLDPSYGWCGTQCYGYFYNWEISAGVDCGRVPVIATFNCGLPVQYISFKATPMASKVYLDWQTSSEQNASHFAVQRSADGINFVTIGNVQAAGNSSTPTTYSFTDYNPLNGTSYYRLVQYDKDGPAFNSETVSVGFNNPGVIVSPNPNQGKFNVSMKAEAGEQIRISLVNALGQVVAQQTLTSDSGDFSTEVNIADLPSGVYFLHVTGSDLESVEKIVKE
ncbi:MAG: T9SS type A sorting domain-containing protein [Cytophagaceae bacterium]|nr:T9SS type A sorting domain-containing protein [Cytophagaceae bacterium]